LRRGSDGSTKLSDAHPDPNSDADTDANSVTDTVADTVANSVTFAESFHHPGSAKDAWDCQSF